MSYRISSPASPLIFSVFQHILYFSKMLCLMMRMQSCPTLLASTTNFWIRFQVIDTITTCPNHTEILAHTCLHQISLFKKENTPLGIAIKDIYLATNNLGCCLLSWCLLVSCQAEWNGAWSTMNILMTRDRFVRKGSVETETEIRRPHVLVGDKKQKIRTRNGGEG